MICPQCGSTQPDDAQFCVKCGRELAEASAEEPQTVQAEIEAGVEVEVDAIAAPAAAPPEEETQAIEPETPSPAAAPLRRPVSPRRKRRIRVLSGLLSLALVLAIGGYFAWQHYLAAPLYSLVPRDSVGVASVDAAWLLKTSNDLRQLPQVRDALAKLEKDSGVTLAKVAPWVGSIAVSIQEFNAGDDVPTGALYIQIRNKVVFARYAGQLHEVLDKYSKKQGVAWQKGEYRGISVERAQIAPVGEIAIAAVGGWLIVGRGKGVIERVIDARTGHAPSIAKDATWSKTLAQVPGHPIFMLGMDGDSLERVLGNLDSELAQKMKASGLKDAAIAVSLSETGTGVQLDFTSATRSDTVRKRWQQLRQETGTVDGLALAQMPESTALTMLFARPGKWLEFSKEMALETAEGSDRDRIQQLFSGLAPLLDHLNNYTGECGLGLTWHDKDGLGIILTGQTDSASAAEKTADSLRDKAESNMVQITRDGPRCQLAMPEQNIDTMQMKVQPCWEAKEAWVRLSSHPTWLNTAGPARIQVPSAARGASGLLVGKLSFLPAILREMGERAYGDEKAMLTKLQELHLENADFCAWTKLHPKGESSTSSLLVNHLDWQAMMKMMVTITGRAREKAQ